jgi:hypothetical protein
MVDLYRRGVEIQTQGMTEKWEHEGGRRGEYIDVCNALHRALGRRPWQYCVLDDDLSAARPGDPDLASAIEARQQLERYVPRVLK